MDLKKIEEDLEIDFVKYIINYFYEHLCIKKFPENLLSIFIDSYIFKDQISELPECQAMTCTNFAGNIDCDCNLEIYRIYTMLVTLSTEKAQEYGDEFDYTLAEINKSYPDITGDQLSRCPEFLKVSAFLQIRLHLISSILKEDEIEQTLNVKQVFMKGVLIKHS